MREWSVWATAPKAGSAKSILAFSREELHDLRRSCSGDRQELVGQGLLLTFSPQKDAGEEGQGDIPLGGFAEEWAPRLPSAASPRPRGVGAGILVKKTTRRPPQGLCRTCSLVPGISWHGLKAGGCGHSPLIGGQASHFLNIPPMGATGRLS